MYSKGKSFKKIIAVTLCLVMMLGIIPSIAFTEDLPLALSGEIISFKPLDDSIAYQTVPLGTELEELDLPQTLYAVLRLPLEIEPEEKPAYCEDSEETDDLYYDYTGNETEEPGEDEANQNDNEQDQYEYESVQCENEQSQIEDKPNQNEDEQAQIEDESNQCENTDNDADTDEGEPIENEEAIEPPETEPEIYDDTDTDDSSSLLEDILDSVSSLFAMHAYAYGDSISEQAVRIPITWQAEPEFDGEVVGEYIFTPILGCDFTFYDEYSEYAEPPTITVEVGIDLLAKPANANVFFSIPMIGAGYNHTVVMQNDGTTWAWGVNWAGQLGDGTTNDNFVPANILNNATAVSVGGNHGFHNMIIAADGALLAWGGNRNGQLGDGTNIGRHTPTSVKTDVASVSAGGGHTMAITTDGNLYAWGDNFAGQLGDGTSVGRHTPIRVKTDVASVSAGGGHTMAITTSGDLYAWGYNSQGMLGDGTSFSRSSPQLIKSNTVSVSAGAAHTLAITDDGDLFAWGANNYGEIGNGTSGNGIRTSVLNPVFVMSNVAAISAGDSHSMAITTDGDLFAWGDNRNGRLGDGTTVAKDTPVLIMSGVLEVSAGVNHTIALRNDGTLWKWGWMGEFRDVGGVFAERVEWHTPVQVQRPDGNGYMNLFDGTPEPPDRPTLNDDIAQRTITIHSGLRGEDIDIPVWFGGDFFANDGFYNSSNYNHSLATTAMALSAAAYGRGGDTHYTINESYIINALGASGLGFSNIRTFNYNQNHPNNIGFILASKNLNFGIGNELLVATVIRGTEDEEWHGNFNIGTNTNHNGFNQAKETVRNTLISYVANSQIIGLTYENGRWSLYVSPIKFFITGHSRGAAVANLLAADLINDMSDIIRETRTQIMQNNNFAHLGISEAEVDAALASAFSANNVFAYTFATPNVTTLPAARDNNFPNIFNVVNAEDFVIYLPLAVDGWNYWKYGTSLVFPSGGTDGRNPRFTTAQIRNMRSFFNTMTGQVFDYFDLGFMPLQNFVRDLHTVVPSASDFYLPLPNNPAVSNPGSPYNYFHHLAMLLRQNIGHIISMLQFQSFRPINDFLIDHNNRIFDNRLMHSHTPEAYLAWLRATGGNDMLFHRDIPPGLFARIACPVDVEVFDENGELVGQVINNIVTEGLANEIGVFVSDDIKNLFFPLTGEFSIRFAATDTDTMSFRVESYNIISGETYYIREFVDVKLYDGKMFRSSVSGEIAISETRLFVTDSGGNPIAEVQQDGTEIPIQTAQYTITATAGTGGTVSGSGTFAPNASVTLTATPNNGYAFRGWYENNERVTDAGAIFTFNATRNRTIEARFSPIMQNQTFTITFNPNGGQVYPTSMQTGLDGRLVNLPTPTRAEYNFNGWWIPTIGGPQVTTSHIFTSNTTIYARWIFTGDGNVGNDGGNIGDDSGNIGDDSENGNQDSDNDGNNNQGNGENNNQDNGTNDNQENINDGSNNQDTNNANNVENRDSHATTVAAATAGDIPRTGDNSNAGLWIILLLSSIAALSVLTIKWHRKKT